MSSTALRTGLDTKLEIVGVATGILGMYVTDTYGIKTSCIVSSACNFLGILIRLASTLPFFASYSPLLLHYTGQTIAAFAQPFLLCLPPKVAQFWFPESQRTLANAIAFISNPIGVIIGSLTPAVIVHGSNLSQELIVMNSGLTALAAAIFLMSLLIRGGRPPTPPSPSTESVLSPPFFEGLCLLFKNRAFYVQMITATSGFAIIFSIFLAGDRMFDELGYPEVNGYGMALGSGVGCVGALFGGFFVDRTKKFSEVIKLSYLGTALSVLGITLFFRFQQYSQFNLVLIMLLITLINFFSSPTWPVSLELGVETTFPVAEATSAGVLVTCGQLFLFVLGYSMKGVAALGSTSSNNPYQAAVDLWCLVTFAVTIFTFIFLHPRHKRLEFEQKELQRKAEMSAKF
uniref:MFS domain-containing protein n=1 Tax=Steinernema glaseri TaxID=37863 RepID=A0A1I7YQD6_9BILA